MDFHQHGFDFDDDGDCLIGECNEIHPNYRMREGHSPLLASRDFICLPKW